MNQENLNSNGKRNQLDINAKITQLLDYMTKILKLANVNTPATNIKIKKNLEYKHKMQRRENLETKIINIKLHWMDSKQMEMIEQEVNLK